MVVMGLNKEVHWFFDERMVPPVTNITGEVILYKHRISGIGEVHLKTKSPGCITWSFCAASCKESEQEQWA